MSLDLARLENYKQHYFDNGTTRHTDIAWFNGHPYPSLCKKKRISIPERAGPTQRSTIDVSDEAPNRGTR